MASYTHFLHAIYSYARLSYTPFLLHSNSSQAVIYPSGLLDALIGDERRLLETNTISSMWLLPEVKWLLPHNAVPGLTSLFFVVNMLRSKGEFGFDFTLKKAIWLSAAGKESIPLQQR